MGIKLMNCYLTLGLLLFVATAFSQTTSSADTSGNAYNDALSVSYTLRKELFLEGLKNTTTDKKLLKHYESSYKEVFNAIHEEIKEGQVLNIPVISAQLQKMLREIKAKNPIVPDDIQIYLHRDDMPNATTMGDNNIFVNIGLFYCLETEDELAGVLSHEVGHLLMEHTMKALKYSYETDKESVVHVKAIRQVETKKSERAFELLKNSVYKGGKLRRHYEMQADSIGYVLHKNTSYQQHAFVDALEKIDRYDTTVQGNILVETYKRFFDLPNQKFDDKWLKAEDFSSYNYEAFTPKLDKDSVSTHPEGKERIQHLKSTFSELTQHEAASKVTESTSFNNVKLIAEKERMPNLFFNERYGEVVYTSLLHLQKNPEDTTYKEWLNKGLQKIYEARRDYKLNKYLDRVTPKEQTESYMRFLNFMWNLNLNELKNISNFYSAQ